MGLLYYVSYLAVLAAFAFVTLSLASGLLYVSELIEEHSRFAKQIGQRGIYAIIFLHALFCVTDSLPFLQTAFSVICHIVYLQNFSHTWPLISLSSPTFLASCFLVVVDHFIWFFYFSQITHQARYSRSYRGGGPAAPGFTEIASFFGICVWLAPLFLFLSLSANDNALPMSSGSPTTSSFSVASSSTRVSLFRSIFSFLPFAKNKSHQNNGIIAPRSPQAIRHPSPNQYPPPPMSPHMPLASARTSAPPRSPGLTRSPLMGAQELELSPPTPTSNFRLHAPPVARRSVQTLSSSGSALGLGVRRSTRLDQNDG